MLTQAWREFWGNDQVVLFILAALIGAAAGYGAIAFRLLTAGLQFGLFGNHMDQIVSYAARLPWWQLLLVPTMGGLAVGLFTRYVLPGRLPQGVADVMAASSLRSGRMSLREGLASALVSAGSIGCGASVGREGPIVHLGASFASAVAQRMHLSPSLARTLLGCGVAAAIASAFNAPIAGVFFALEVVIGHYGIGAFSPVVISSVIGTVITRIHIGADAAFILPPQQITSFWELPAFIILGLVCALSAMGLLKGIDLVQTIQNWLGLARWLRPAAAGLIVGLIALQFPEVLGVGYETTDNALKGNYGLTLLVLLAFAKGAATVVCLGSGFGGGIFSPSLVLGAMVGSAYGLIAVGFFPDLGSSTSVYALLAMAAVAACTLGAPISTIIMVFELTADYGITFALMVTVAIASVLFNQLHWHSFFSWQLLQRGIDLYARHDQRLLASRTVAEVMKTEVVTVGLDADLDHLKSMFLHRHLPIFVVDDERRLVGTIHFEDLADAAFESDPKKAPSASDLVHRLPIALTPEDDLEKALRICEANHEEHMPVVKDNESKEVIAEVCLTDLFLAQNLALLEARALEHGER
ncbi:MAG: chloride channel protein [Alphaproteobacteria bacterium]|nr:chloride channel protein [Alphaproteobacteria bacterium]